MNSLDENVEYIDPSSISIWPTVLKYGLMLGLAGIAFKLASFMIDLGDLTLQSIVAIAGLVVSILILRSAIKYFRDDELGGHITVGKVISLGVPIVIISSLLSVLFQYVYVNFIDPSIIDQTIQASMETFEKMGLDVPDETVDEMEQGIRDGMGLQNLLLTGLGGGAIGGLIISAIMGAIMKKEAPMV